jgi:predicted RNase H-like HicB family nuclease
MTTENQNDIDRYMLLPYTTILHRDQDGDMVAVIQELAGCSAHGRSEQDALENVKEAQRLWIQDCLEAGQAVPLPEEAVPLPSGKWVQRVPRSLHRKLANMAKREGVSLNQLVTSILAQASSAGAWEIKAEPILHHMLSGEITDQHIWGAAANVRLVGAAPDFHWCVNRTSSHITLEALRTVERLFSKKSTIKNAAEAEENTALAHFAK